MMGRMWCRGVGKVSMGWAGIVGVFMSVEWEIVIEEEGVLCGKERREFLVWDCGGGFFFRWFWF